MIYADNCCCCMDLKCGCILIAIVEVLIRGIDRFFVEYDTLLGYATLILSGVYVISCVFLLLGAVMQLRIFLLPYLWIGVIRLVALIVEFIYYYLNTDEIVYEYLYFDVFQAGLYFWLVVYSFYDVLRKT
ncbi:GL10089 [Drosophila persimilis]|uniref:GL10089 n=1 Tax=Drosophila persimilis TaxID=7234 RepID=B4H5A2_DROPE|nr:GL10089 [Drosophila persimilis]